MLKIVPVCKVCLKGHPREVKMVVLLTTVWLCCKTPGNKGACVCHVISGIILSGWLLMYSFEIFQEANCHVIFLSFFSFHFNFLAIASGLWSPGSVRLATNLRLKPASFLDIWQSAERQKMIIVCDSLVSISAHEMPTLLPFGQWPFWYKLHC